MLKLISNIDAHAADACLLQGSDTIYAIVIAANTEGHITIPSGATYVLLSATANCYSLIGTSVTAAVPSGNITNGTAPALNKAGYAIRGTDTTISCISPSACVVTLEFYQ